MVRGPFGLEQLDGPSGSELNCLFEFRRNANIVPGECINASDFTTATEACLKYLAFYVDGMHEYVYAV